MGLVREGPVAPINRVGSKNEGEFGEKATVGRSNGMIQSSRPSEVRAA